MAKIRVVVVDDSPAMRQLLTAILDSDEGIEVVGTAADPHEAREVIKATEPDVLTLDVEMPRMDGLTFLGKLMRLRPMPVLMVSTLTARGADAALQALELGAVDCVGKPTVGDATDFALLGAELISKVRLAARAKVRTPSVPAAPPAPAPRPATGALDPRQLLAIGASTGGTEAIHHVLATLPADAPGTVIALHIPAQFSNRFAQRMDGVGHLRVSEAEDGAAIQRGHVYIAPGGKHLRVVRTHGGYRCQLTMTEPVHRQRPAVDVLFASVAEAAGAHAIGAILTGMGADGADGLLAMRKAGSHTVVQDEETSVVWGMPKAAMQLGAAEKVLPLDRISGRLASWWREGR